MNRRAFLAATLLPAVLLLFPVSAGARQVPRANEEAPPTSAREAAGFPLPPHEAGLPSPRGGGQRPSQSLTKEEKRLLAVPPEVRRPHADFLERPRTGIVRLLPRETYDRKLKLRGGGAYYSFAHREHQYGYGSDIELQRGYLSSGFAGADFGFLTDLGDVPLEFVSAETEALHFMTDFKIPSDEPEAREAALWFSRIAGQRVEGRWVEVNGQQVGEWYYARRLPAVVGHTYALRSINYDSSDVLVAFRVLQKDDNGSIVLLWKMLKKFATPTLRRRS